MEPDRCYELAIAWLANDLAIFHHGFPSQYCTYRHAFNSAHGTESSRPLCKSFRC
jgi:hypothetical protein